MAPQQFPGERWANIRARLILYFRHHGSRDPDEDTQETLTRVLQKLEKVTTELEHYCYGVAKNVLREGRKTKVGVELDEGMPDTSASSSTAALDRRILAEECLHDTPVSDQRFLNRYYEIGCEAIAKEEGISPNAARVRMSRKMGEVRERVKRKGKKKGPGEKPETG